MLFLVILKPDLEHNHHFGSETPEHKAGCTPLLSKLFLYSTPFDLEI